ncbi:MAG TPA: FKBP-type peptidyl-prolyl cis-trans isomerase [Chitinispirillaceae bacterium]|nr:FKBP-type peptidyl-prolyl cis-trans isomerase [Chitinispirillaceae bacterium]
MNNSIKTILFTLCATFSINAAEQNEILALNDYFDSLSYVLGRDIGTQLKEIGATVRIPAFNEGIRQALQGESAILDSTSIDSIRRRFAEYIKEQMTQKEKQLASTNREAAQKFLEENKKLQDVKTTSSGLQYQILKKAKGISPSATDSVVVLYKGNLIDGTVIDSTPASQPATLDLSKTIPGLTEGIQLMSIGSKYRFFIPPELAYGSMGAPPAIPPESVLIFDIELIDIPGKKANTGTLY